MTPTLPTTEALKEQAKRLRASLDAAGHRIGHSEALETIARQHGFRDWNTLSAKARCRHADPPVQIGERVSGHYLGQAFTGRVKGITGLSADRYRVTIRFDEPVDVVTFDSFSSFRTRVQSVIDGSGTALRKTSNGRPHLELDLKRG